VSSAVDKQKVLIASLQNPSIFPHESDNWQLIETHISWVVLSGCFAYKIKKALDLGFLDFTTLESRKFYCEEELRLNSRLAPELYLKVVPVTGTATQPLLGGSDAVIEYAVKMKRFPPAALLSELIDQGELGAEHIDQLFLQVSRFHLDIPAAPADTRFGIPEHVHAPAVENFCQLRERVSDPLYLEWLDRLQKCTDKEFHRCNRAFQHRKELGFVRECHGDMHLGNMVMIEDVPLIFDGIEFNPDLYWIDVMNEVAFLFMDLEHHGKRDYAFRFLNGYLELTGDYAGLQVFSYYLAYRAIVRAKVASISVDQQSNSEASFVSIELFEQYLQLALSYCLPQYPVLLITHGLSGSGKSTLSAMLAEHLGAIRIRSDRERQRVLGKGNRDGRSAGIDSGVYSKSATEQTYAALHLLAESVLGAGYSVIVDATFLGREQRDPFRRLATRLAIPIRVLSLRAEPEELKRRIIARQSEGRDISEANLSVLGHQLSNYEGLGADEEREVVIIDTHRSCSAQEMLALITRTFEISPEFACHD